MTYYAYSLDDWHYAYSLDDRHYHGAFETREEAAEEAREHKPALFWTAAIVGGRVKRIMRHESKTRETHK